MVATRPGKEGPERRRGERRPGPPLLGHLVAIDGGHGGRRLAGQVDQDRRRRSPVLGPVVDAGKHDQGGNRLEVERDRQQHGDRGGRPDAGQHADGGAKGNADQAVEEVLGLQRRLEAECQVARTGPSVTYTGIHGPMSGTRSCRPTEKISTHTIVKPAEITTAGTISVR